MNGKTLITLALLLFLKTASAQEKSSGATNIIGPESEAPVFRTLRPWSSDPELNKYPGYGYFRTSHSSTPLQNKIWLNMEIPVSVTARPESPIWRQRKSISSDFQKRFWLVFGEVATAVARELSGIYFMGGPYYQ